jgi:superfamily II DNA helicase RecQ
MTNYATFFANAYGEATAVEELNTFIRSHRVMHVEKRLIESEGGTGWLFLVEYLVGQQKEGPRDTFGGPRVDYKSVLSEKDFELFNRLRNVRKELADATGNPVYAVFTNEQLSQIARSKPTSMKDLLGIAGVGESRVAQYGEQMIAVVAGGASETNRGPV